MASRLKTEKKMSPNLDVVWKGTFIKKLKH